jgi:hypothetical protein
MNADKKLYLYSGLAIIGSLVAYAIITKKKPSPTEITKKKPSSTDSEGNETVDAETNVTTTTTGDIIDKEQQVIPKTLSNILNKTSAQATLALVNKPVYTKLEDVKVRRENYVNNGIINNVMSTITDRGFLLGNVIQVVDDKGKLKNNDGRVWKWFRIKPVQSTLDEMNKNKDFLTAKFLPLFTKEIYVREDVVKLEK